MKKSISIVMFIALCTAALQGMEEKERSASQTSRTEEQRQQLRRENLAREQRIDSESKQVASERSMHELIPGLSQLPSGVGDIFSSYMTVQDVAPRLWVATLEPKLLHKEADISQAIFSQDSQYLITGNTKGVISLRDPHTAQTIRDLNGTLGDLVTALAVNAETTLITAATVYKDCKIWDAQTGRVRTTLAIPHQNTPNYISTIFFNPNNTQILTIPYGDGFITTWDIKTGKLLYALGDQQQVLAQYSPNGTRILTIHGYIYGFDVKTRTDLWNTNTGTLLISLPPQDIRAASFDMTGTSVITANATEIALWNALTGQKLKVLTGHPYRTKTIRFSFDNKYVIASGYTNILSDIIYVWDVSTGQNIYTSDDNEHQQYLSLSFDNRILCTTNFMKATATLFDFQTGQPLQTLKGFSSQLKSGAFSPDSSRLAFIDHNNNMYLYSTTSSLNNLSSAQFSLLAMLEEYYNKGHRNFALKKVAQANRIKSSDLEKALRSFAPAIRRKIAEAYTIHMPIQSIPVVGSRGGQQYLLEKMGKKK